MVTAVQVFSLEMAVKWCGLGVKHYFAVPSNRFDFFLVWVSLAEQGMLLTQNGTALGPVSVLRCFRCGSCCVWTSVSASLSDV